MLTLSCSSPKRLKSSTAIRNHCFRSQMILSINLPSILPYGVSTISITIAVLSLYLKRIITSSITSIKTSFPTSPIYAFTERSHFSHPEIRVNTSSKTSSERVVEFCYVFLYNSIVPLLRVRYQLQESHSQFVYGTYLLPPSSR